MMKPKRIRQESAIKRLEKTVAAHTAGTDLVKKILEDKSISKTSEEIEKIRKKKLDRAQKTIENTKARLKKNTRESLQTEWTFLFHIKNNIME